MKTLPRLAAVAAAALAAACASSPQKPQSMLDPEANFGAYRTFALPEAGAGGEGGGVEEDLLAVIGADEAEPLLLVVELDLAGGHRVNLARVGGARWTASPCSIQSRSPRPIRGPRAHPRPLRRSPALF